MKGPGRPDGREPKGGRWQPMQRAEPVPITPEQHRAIRDMAVRIGRDAAEADGLLAELGEPEMWQNDQYTATVTRREDGSVMELSVRRNDRKSPHDWRHLQRIKSEVAGPEVEAAELYPAESRLMDTANQFYLWCLPPGERFQFGYQTERNLRDTDEAEQIGAGQRPLPDDWKGC